MRHSITLKFLAVLLAAISLTAAVGCTAGIVALESAELYINGLDALQDQTYESIAREIARSLAEIYAVETLGDLPYSLKGKLYSDPRGRVDADHWRARLSEDGKQLAEEGFAGSDFAFTRTFTIAPLYIVASLYSPEDMIPPETTPTVPEEDPEAPQDPPQAPSDPVEPAIPLVPEGYLYYSQETVLQNSNFLTYYLYYYQAPEYKVTVQLQEDVLDYSSLHMLRAIYPYRIVFILALAGSLLLAAVCIVYLFLAAGHCADGSIQPGALNRIPLDLYGIISIGTIFLLVSLLQRLWTWVQNEGPHTGNLSLIGFTLFGISVVGIAYLTAIAAQIKVRDGFWWRHSMIGWFLRKLVFGFQLLGKGLYAIMRLLPQMWHWLVCATLIVLSLIITFILMYLNRNNGIYATIFLLVFLLNILVGLTVILYSGYCYAKLIRGVRKMNEGNLNQKISTRYLQGSYREFAQELNALSETALVSAEKHLASERTKSELITNVTHDIKTPLTSIINFVDLLQRPHTPAQQQEYLEVLSRQSSRMKKLIEDLLELSKASSGTITANLMPMDAAETVLQALGEFSDKLDESGVKAVFQVPDQPLMIQADGRLTWRILSNLLSNVAKYALPGTRLYVELAREDGHILLSLKNVSREPLNMRTEELMERFVRGDVSRQSEGSGLGLNIAKNLMEVQGGQLRLQLDGDLFKVTLLFPEAAEETAEHS